MVKRQCYLKERQDILLPDMRNMPEMVYLALAGSGMTCYNFDKYGGNV
jgi:hypothetical protein